MRPQQAEVAERPGAVLADRELARAEQPCPRPRARRRAGSHRAGRRAEHDRHEDGCDREHLAPDESRDRQPASTADCERSPAAGTSLGHTAEPSGRGSPSTAARPTNARAPHRPGRHTNPPACRSVSARPAPLPGRGLRPGGRGRARYGDPRRISDTIETEMSVFASSLRRRRTTARRLRTELGTHQQSPERRPRVGGPRAKVVRDRF